MKKQQVQILNAYGENDYFDGSYHTTMDSREWTYTLYCDVHELPNYIIRQLNVDVNELATLTISFTPCFQDGTVELSDVCVLTTEGKSAMIGTCWVFDKSKLETEIANDFDWQDHYDSLVARGE